LMAAAPALPSPLRAATYETFIGLLAVTGLRVGEAIRLDRDHVDWNEGVAQRAVAEGRANSVSAYVADALEEKAKLDDLASLLDEMLAETGGPPRQPARTRRSPAGEAPLLWGTQPGVLVSPPFGPFGCCAPLSYSCYH